jgi:hypothetical protein
MAKIKQETIDVQGKSIVLYEGEKGDYISLSDIARYRIVKEVIIFCKTGSAIAVRLSL